MNKKFLTNAAKVAVSVILIYFLVKKVGLSQFVEDLRNINFYYLFWAAMFSFIGFFIQAARLKVIIEAQKIKIRYLKVFLINLVSAFFGIFLPTIIGGDVVKMAILSSQSGKKAVSVGVVTMDRVIGTYALVFVALIAGVFGRKFLTHEIVIYTVDAFILAFIAMMLLNIKKLWKYLWNLIGPKLGKKFDALNTFVETLQSYGIANRFFVKAFAWSLLFYITIVLSSYFVSLSLGLTINPLVFFVFVPLLSLASMAPISISGIGVRESVSVIFFSTMGITASFGVLLSFIPFAIKALISLIGGIAYPFTGFGRKRK